MAGLDDLRDVVVPRVRGQWLTHAIPLAAYGFLGARVSTRAYVKSRISWS